MKLNLFTIFLVLLSVVKTESVDQASISKIYSDEWMVKFYADWCPACQRFESIWDDFTGDVLNRDINFAEIDIENSREIAISFGVTHLPSVFHVKDGQVRLYEGDLSTQTLVDFVNNDEWVKVDPFPWYRHPNGVVMKSLSYVSFIAEYVLQLHEFLMSKYELSQTMATVILIGSGFASSIVLALITSFTITSIATLIFGKPGQMSPNKSDTSKKSDSKKSEKSDANSSQTESTKINSKKSDAKKRAVRE